MNKRFRMAILEVFHFEDGTTVFAGEIIDGPDSIGGGMYGLTVDGNDLGTVKINSERQRGSNPSIRSIDTTQKLSFNSGSLRGKEVYFEILEHA